MSVNSSDTIIDVTSSTCDYINGAIHVMKVILLLPLCTYLLYLAKQQWRQQHSFWSHSDLFTFHMAAMELFWIFGFFCCLCADCPVMSSVGNCAIHVAFYGEILFHVLTCVERYMAVVHPVFYHGLKSKRGHRIKIVTIGAVWLLSFGLTVIELCVRSIYNSVSLLCLLNVSMLATSFCSFYAICSLIRPTPGRRKKERADQSKRRALLTIIFLWSMLCLWFVMLLVRLVIGPSQCSYTVKCLASTSLNWFNLCNSLVLPMLFFHRAGKMSCSCNS